MKPEYIRGTVARILESALPLHIPTIFDEKRPAGTGYCTEDKIVIGVKGNEDEDFPKMVAVLAHEILHIVSEHHQRAKEFVPLKDESKWILWNLAADDAVNRVLKDVLEVQKNLVKVATQAKRYIEEAGVDLSRLTGYPEDAPTEVIYRWLLEKEREGKIRWCYVSGSSSGESDRKGDGSSEIEVEIDGRKYRVTVSRRFEVTDGTSMAAQRHAMEEAFKNRGTNPFARQRDWREAGERYSLEKFLREHFRTFTSVRGKNLTFLYPNRRIMALSYPIIFPERVRKTVNALVAVDTSGSITEKEMDSFYNTLFANLHLLNFDLVFCDAKLYGPYRLSDMPPEQVKLKLRSIKPKGGGGTSYEPVFEFFRNGKYNLLIYFTDLYCDFPEKHPPRILWVVQKNQSTYKINPPYGKVVWF